MFIRNCLTERGELTVLDPHETVRSALGKLAGHLSLPCVSEEDSFLGMVSKRTIFEQLENAMTQGLSHDAFLNTEIAACIDTSVAPLTLESHFEETLEIVIRHPFVPIVEEGKLIGIVKRSDVHHALEVAFATQVPSQRLLIGTAEVSGALHELFNITHRLGINVITVAVFDAAEHALNRRLILKISHSSRLDDFMEHLEKAGFSVLEVDR